MMIRMSSRDYARKRPKRNCFIQLGAHLSASLPFLLILIQDQQESFEIMPLSKFGIRTAIQLRS